MSSLPVRVQPESFPSTADRRGRTLGSDYAPQSQTYLLRLPCLLGFTAAYVWAVPTDSSFVLGSLVGSLISLYVLVDIVLRSAPVRFTTIYGMTLLLGYALGSFNTWLTMPRGGLTVAESFARNPVALTHAIAVCLATAALLFVVGELFERPIFGREFRLAFGNNTLPIAIFTTLSLAVAYAAGKIALGGLVVDDSGHIDPLTSLIMWWAIPAYAYTACAALNSTGTRRLFLWTMVLIQTVALVPLGRRQFGFALILAMIAVRLGKYRIRMPLYKMLLLGIAGASLIGVASMAFLYLRVAGYEIKGRGGQKITLQARFQELPRLVKEKSPAEIFDLLQSNVSGRTFMIAYFSDLLDASQRSAPLFGSDMLYNIESAIPSAISQYKFRGYSEEILVNLHWGFSYQDEANSLLTAGAADFGFLGVLCYPLLLLFMLRFALEWLQSGVPTSLAVIVALGFLFQSMLPETAVAGYLLQVRSAILVVIAYYFLSRLPRFQLKRAE
jgi:hypothetical protein